MKAIGYCRVSTQCQAEDGVSLEAQEAKIRAWAELNGFDEVRLFVDAGISGNKAENREGLQSALKAVGDGDALVVYSLSRLARSTKDTLTIADYLAKRGADLVSICEKIDTTTAAGKMVFRMLAVLSEFERDQISERTKGALAHKKSKGERVGAVPYGFRVSSDGKTLKPSAQEQAAIQAAKEMKRDGLSLCAIASRLSAQGFASRNGKTFHAMQISRMITA